MIIDLDAMEKDIATENTVTDVVVGLDTTIERIVDSMGGANIGYFVGCGDSYFASIYAKYTFEKLAGIPIVSEESYEILQRGLARSSFLVGVSASGRTEMTVKALMYAKKHNVDTYALTCSMNSPVTRYAKKVIFIPFRDSVTSPTITSMAFLATIYYWALKIKHRKEGAPDPEDTLRNKITFSDPPKDFLDRLIDYYVSSEHTYIVGGGPSYTTALFLMAKIRELNLGHSMAFELEEFMHYGNIPVGKDSLIIVFGSEYDRERISKLVSLVTDLGARIVVISNYEDRYVSLVLDAEDSLIMPMVSLNFSHKFVVGLARRVWGRKIVIKHGERIAKIIRAKNGK